ncbi:RNase H domain-containing protein [Nephila pilipes]|uniref:RNase H domain-containing protein n=1 Tax=Nephila pilipes TaxID=299642 RepID=A0A8X6MN26_NEPPI|nr:RNase H domain-containing protein [Nephila pilipes]
MLTDGRKNDSDCSDNGIYIRYRDKEVKIQKINPNFCSVFHSEFIAIKEALELLKSLSHNNEIWILSYSISCIQHLANWQSVRDNDVEEILKTLKCLSTSHQINLQWILSHVGIEGHEIADTLTKAGASEASMPSGGIT